MRGFKASTWLGERLLQEWGHWCVQYLETFGCGCGATSGEGDRRPERAPGDYSNPVLAGLIGSEIASGLNQTIHLLIAERSGIDRRVALLRYVGRPTKATMRGGEPVIWRGEVPIGGGHRAVIEFPEPALLQSECVPVTDTSPAALGRELGVSAEQVREATRRLRTLAVKAYRRANVHKRAA
jgi:hypothetical protein